ncbi:MAG: DUF5665 domain-containing protein [Oscillospiraceae bacterium]|jgi:hypothetical protein|nr:MAG: DUF5665 domain-containing protein [Oscillospiraceae bacterium]
MKKAEHNIKRARLIAVRALDDYIYYLTDKKRIVKSNFLAGLMRGIGTGIGFWLLSALLAVLFAFLADNGVPLVDKLVEYFIKAAQKYS